MLAFYSLKPLKEIEISGTSSEWSDFARSLRDGSIVACDVGDPGPYESFALAVAVRHLSGEKVRFAVDDGKIVVSGDPDLLHVVAETAAALAGPRPSKYHVHVEHLGGDHHIAADSIPAVFFVWHRGGES
jgi:hypothetical protein